MQLVYYGVITNNTKDDWKEVFIYVARTHTQAKMALSTAQPAISGHPPELRTLRVYFEGKSTLFVPFFS